MAIKGVGESQANKLQKLGIRTVTDLIEYVPRRFDDFSRISTVNRISPGNVTLKVKLGTPKGRYSRRGLHITEVLASDETGSVKVMWFNQPYRAKALKPGAEYYISGEYAANHRFFAITNPACELVSSFPINTARFVPVYRLTKGLGATQLRKAMKSALEIIVDAETLPEWIIEDEQLMARDDALRQMHFPDEESSLHAAKRRLGFEEVFELTLASELNKQAQQNTSGYSISYDDELIKNFVSHLPFQLTDDQRRVSWQILQDLASDAPMNRLVEGDVGSGKTVVAALAALQVMHAGYQVALMAPTELLARQHAESLSALFEDTSYFQAVTLSTGSMTKNQKDSINGKIANGEAKCIIGTHALFQKNVSFHNLALVILDEQHRFGVEQRKALLSKGDAQPHVLSMTATPIPRSLALTLYGELDISVIKQLPKGRKAIDTSVYISEFRAKVYKLVAEELVAGRQAFIVCPQIDESDSAQKSVKTLFNELQKKWLKDFKLALLHGQMSADEKNEVMEAFLCGKIDALISTTVIEVGVNVPNASVMVIESAEQFGLAQLHQLRGRVGRGTDQAYCYLITTTNDEPPQRLRLIEQESNGFKLAEYDLDCRGPGAIYGTLQSGALDLRVAKLSDVSLIESARQAAKQFIERRENLLHYEHLHKRVSALRKVVNLN